MKPGTTKVTMYTDGACSGNPGPGGWAALLRWNDHEKLVSGGDPATTNNRMELLAVIQGLRSLKRGCAVRIVTDSRYVMDGMTKWIAGWRRRGWKTASKAPVKNQDLWESLDREISLHQVEWEWVRGHSGHEENARVDAAARAAIPF